MKNIDNNTIKISSIIVDTPSTVITVNYPDGFTFDNIECYIAMFYHEPYKRWYIPYCVTNPNTINISQDGINISASTISSSYTKIKVTLIKI